MFVCWHCILREFSVKLYLRVFGARDRLIVCQQRVGRAGERVVKAAWSGLMDAAVTAHYWFHYIRFLKLRPTTVEQAVPSTLSFYRITKLTIRYGIPLSPIKTVYIPIVETVSRSPRSNVNEGRSKWHQPERERSRGNRVDYGVIKRLRRWAARSYIGSFDEEISTENYSDHNL